MIPCDKHDQPDQPIKNIKNGLEKKKNKYQQIRQCQTCQSMSIMSNMIKYVNWGEFWRPPMDCTVHGWDAQGLEIAVALWESQVCDWFFGEVNEMTRNVRPVHIIHNNILPGLQLWKPAQKVFCVFHCRGTQKHISLQRPGISKNP